MLLVLFFSYLIVQVYGDALPREVVAHKEAVLTGQLAVGTLEVLDVELSLLLTVQTLF